jgi:hypothetical protein
MYCTACRSASQAEFPAEMIIHFRGLENVDKPGVWVFPKVLLCLDCGFTQFTVQDKELTLLASSAPTSDRSRAQQKVDEDALPIELIL